jgi:hypothetical protein
MRAVRARSAPFLSPSVLVWLAYGHSGTMHSVVHVWICVPKGRPLCEFAGNQPR